jgi:hypothetical protein
VMACREGLALANDTLLTHVRIASDRANVVRNIHGATMGSYRHIAKEIKAQVSNLQKAVFVHEKREANTEAHNLARSSIVDLLGKRVWLISLPTSICNSYSVTS